MPELTLCPACGALPCDQTGVSVLSEIGAERERQIEAEGWDHGHDDEHDEGQMADAASCYARGEKDELWPWGDEWWKPKDRRRDLIRAAALIVAEIERLDRTLSMGEK